MTRPEDIARDRIDKRLELAGWVVQDIKTFNPAAGRGLAVREYPTDTGPADYVLLVDRQPVGVIEAKRDEEGQRITEHETQTERYARSSLNATHPIEPRCGALATLLLLAGMGPQRRRPCRARLRLQAQTVAQAGSMLPEFPAPPLPARRSAALSGASNCGF